MWVCERSIKRRLKLGRTFFEWRFHVDVNIKKWIYFLEFFSTNISKWSDRQQKTGTKWISSQIIYFSPFSWLISRHEFYLVYWTYRWFPSCRFCSYLLLIDYGGVMTRVWFPAWTFCIDWISKSILKINYKCEQFNKNELLLWKLNWWVKKYESIVAHSINSGCSKPNRT